MKASSRSAQPSRSVSTQPKVLFAHDSPYTFGQSSARFPTGLSPYPSPSESVDWVGSVLKASDPLPAEVQFGSGSEVPSPSVSGHPILSVVEFPQ